MYQTLAYLKSKSIKGIEDLAGRHSSQHRIQGPLGVVRVEEDAIKHRPANVAHSHLEEELQLQGPDLGAQLTTKKEVSHYISCKHISH